MSEAADCTEDQVLQWRIQTLRHCGFRRPQREVLMVMIELGEIDLAEIRKLIERRGATPDQAYAIILGSELVAELDRLSATA